MSRTRCQPARERWLSSPERDSQHNTPFGRSPSDKKWRLSSKLCSVGVFVRSLSGSVEYLLYSSQCSRSSRKGLRRRHFDSLVGIYLTLPYLIISSDPMTTHLYFALNPNSAINRGKGESRIMYLITYLIKYS